MLGGFVCKPRKMHENSDSIRRDRSDLMVSRIKGALIETGGREKGMILFE